MRKILCRIFSFFLGMFVAVIDVIRDALIAIGTAAVEVLSEVVGSVGSSILNSPVAMVVGGLAIFWIASKVLGLSGLAGSDDDDEKSKPEQGDGLVSS